MKHEWRKKEKYYYLPKTNPEIVNIQELKFIQIKGSGNPNSEEFSQKVGTLYSLSYAIKMMPKKGITPKWYFDYTVYPLEGIWDLTNEARDYEIFDKNNLVYTIMIRQPEFVDEAVFKEAIQILKKKNNNPLLDEVEFVSIDEEYKSFEVMNKFCEDNNILIKNKAHREIYISDFRRTPKERLKTVLRYRIEYK